MKKHLNATVVHFESALDRTTKKNPSEKKESEESNRLRFEIEEHMKAVLMLRSMVHSSLCSLTSRVNSGKIPYNQIRQELLKQQCYLDSFKNSSLHLALLLQGQ